VAATIQFEQQYEEEADHGLERARGRRHAHVPDGRERSVDVSVDDVGVVELGRIARDLVEEAEVRMKILRSRSRR